MKKAQIEIMGLIFIVLIVTIAMLFYVSNSVKDDLNPGIDQFKTYANSELSMSFIEVFLDTSTCGTNIQELIVDCAKSKQIRCDAKTSCEQVEEVAEQILEDTLILWQVPYGLVIEYNSFTNYTNATEDCMPGGQIKGKYPPGRQPISLYPGTAMVELGICVI
jgi:hypothetical protein